LRIANSQPKVADDPQMYFHNRHLVPDLRLATA